MNEGSGEGYKPPITVMEAPKSAESLKGQHFNYTLVFGQGPVQEIDKIPQTGREGLNFYSRLEAKAAAEMLRQGITDHLILSGGKTGARGKTEEGKAEADLMFDLIKSEIGVDEEGNFFKTIGDGNPIKFTDAVLIENLANDSLENFAEIINKFVDKDGFGDAKMALLGIGFHTKPTRYLGVGGADIGRLEALSSIYQLNSPAFSAEQVLRELVIGKKNEDSAVASILGRLTNLSENSNVTMLKAQQEMVLVDMLKEGDWLRKLGSFKNEARIKQVLSKQPETLKELGFTQEELKNVEIGLLREKIQELFKKIQPTQTLYPETKTAVFNDFDAMGNVDGKNITETYGKGELPKK